MAILRYDKQMNTVRRFICIAQYAVPKLMYGEVILTMKAKHVSLPIVNPLSDSSFLYSA